jgi:DNA-binding transcriptional MerR regulator
MESRRPAKSAAAFRTISEVASDLDVPQHVLRFWETKFNQVRPLKRGGGRRYYRPEDVDLLRRIRKLLYADGYTIKGVQKLLREGIGRPVVARELGVAPAPAEPPKPASAEAASPSRSA